MSASSKAVREAIEALRTKPAARGFLLAQFFRDGPRRGQPALSADTGYAAARVIEKLGLAERVNDGKGGNWFYLNPIGTLVRQHFQNEGRGA